MFQMKHIDYKYFKILYNLAKKSYDNGDIPVGAIVLYNNKIIGKGYNNRHKKKNVCGHAEINAIKKAEKYFKDWRLNNCILISTLKPCEMCAEVINASRIKKVYYILNQEDVKYDYDYEKVSDKNYYIEKYHEIFNNFFKNIR